MFHWARLDRILVATGVRLKIMVMTLYWAYLNMIFVAIDVRIVIIIMTMTTISQDTHITI